MMAASATGNGDQKRSGPSCYCIRLILLLTVSLVSCNNTPKALDPLPTPPPVLTAEGTPGSLTAEEADTPDTRNRQLVLWVSSPFESLLEVDTNHSLATVNEQFERNHPGVHIDMQSHAESGEASLLNYLRSAQRVAPAILPDVVLIDTQQLWQLADLELLHPLAWSQIAQNFDFYPFAINAITYQGEQVGIPYMADLTHMLAYPEPVVEMPNTWDEFYALAEPLYFVADKSAVFNEFAYAQYLGAGDALPGSEPVDGDVLLAYFTFLIRAKEQNLIPDAVLSISNTLMAWDAFVAAKRGFAETSTHVVFAHWDSISTGAVQYGPLLSRGGTAPPSARVWAFVIISSDSQQQELSLALLQTLLAPELHSQWGRVAMYVPTQPAAFELWRNSSPYYGFLQQQLAAAFALPNSRRFVDLNHRMQSAQDEVLRGEMTPEEAVLYVQTTP